jgi:hypothetical protein
MSKVHDLVETCTRAMAALALVAAVAASAPTASETASEIASAPDAPAVVSFSGYMVAVG